MCRGFRESADLFMKMLLLSGGGLGADRCLVINWVYGVILRSIFNLSPLPLWGRVRVGGENWGFMGENGDNRSSWSFKIRISLLNPVVQINVLAFVLISGFMGIQAHWQGGLNYDRSGYRKRDY